MADIIISHPDREELESKNIFQWPIWECEISEFPWTYAEKESCYILEGDVEVQTDQDVYHIQRGDFVMFPAGLECIWKVTSPVKKHYRFG